jgi:hypothetical protein
MTTTPAKISTEESLLITANREAGLTKPTSLPKMWNELSQDEQDISIWYLHNVLSYFDKNQVARHVIGLEILANESAGITPVITAQRANEIWKLVFNK